MYIISECVYVMGRCYGSVLASSVACTTTQHLIVQVIPPSHTLHLHDNIRGLSLSLMYQDYDRNLNSKLGLEQLMTAYTMQGKYVILTMLTGSSYRWKNGLR